MERPAFISPNDIPAAEGGPAPVTSGNKERPKFISPNDVPAAVKTSDTTSAYGRGIPLESEGGPSFGWKSAGDVLPAAARGAASTVEGMAGGALGMLPGAVGRAGADLSKYSEEQYKKAKEKSAPGALIGSVVPYVAPGAAMEGAAAKAATLLPKIAPFLESIGVNVTPTMAKMLTRSLVGGMEGATLTPATGETRSERWGEKRYPALIGALAPPLIAGASAAGSALGQKSGQVAKGLFPTKVLDTFAPELDPSTIGQAAQWKLTTNLDAFKAARETPVAKAYADYYAKGNPIAPQVQQKTALDLMQYLNDKSLTKKTAKFVQDSIEDLKRPMNIEGLEKQRREWASRAESFDNKGADAISKDVTDKVGQILRNNLEQMVPDGAAQKAIRTYAETSAPINEWNTLIGQAGVKTKAGEFLPQVMQTSPTDFAKKVFKDTDTYTTFVKLANDPAFVRDTAKKYIRSELDPAKGAKGVDAFVKSNPWLKQDPVLMKELDGVRAALGAGGAAKSAAKAVPYIGAGALGAGWLKSVLGY